MTKFDLQKNPKAERLLYSNAKLFKLYASPPLKHYIGKDVIILSGMEWKRCDYKTFLNMLHSRLSVVTVVNTEKLLISGSNIWERILIILTDLNNFKNSSMDLP